jgi:hypothetical protein
MKTVFLRVIEEEDKATALLAAIHDPISARGRQRFELETSSFSAIPGSTFAYWAGPSALACYEQMAPLKATTFSALSTNQLSDDPRYARLWWEVGQSGTEHWVNWAKGRTFAPFYFDTQTLVRWNAERQTYTGFLGTEHRPLEKPASVDWFFRPGLTWPRRSNQLSVSVLPRGCVFGNKGPAIFAEDDDQTALLALAAILNSQVFGFLLALQIARVELAQSFEVGLIQDAPIPDLSTYKTALSGLARRAWSLRRSLDTHVETSHDFTLPALLQVNNNTLNGRASSWFSKIAAIKSDFAAVQAEIEASGFDLYGIEDEDRRAMSLVYRETATSPVQLDITDQDMSVDEDSDEEAVPSDAGDPVSLALQLVSWAVGAAFGRFDVRLATATRSLPAEPDPFAPLPKYSAGMLVGADGVPSTTPPAEYPLAFPESGILVDDPGHALDLTRAVRAVFVEVFKNSIDAWWEDIAALLDPKSRELRTWLASGFFEYHIKRHSTSRRKAPFLWQLALPSGRYSIWLYAHKLTGDSLFQIQNDILIPKLAHEERQLAILIQDGGSNPSAKARKDIAQHEAFVEELRSFLDEVKRVAHLWNPTLDDGVLLTMAPLWRLVPQHKLWQKELKAKWDELVDETYDWSHAAMHFWPERVVPKCSSDRSLAISHGLETAFWVQSISGPWRQRLGIANTVRYLEENLFSDRLRQTVEELVAFSRSYAASSGDAPDWWAALSTGFRDDTALALALWPERVIRKAVADPDRFAALGIKLPRARNGDEMVAKLLSMHRPRLLDQEIQTLGEFCNSAGNREYWILRWDQFAGGFHDEYSLARAVHTPRVVAKSQADPDFAKSHDLFRWFWLLGDSGPRRLKEPPVEIADALRIRSSPAVKAALKSLAEAPTATVSGVRGRGRQPTTAAPAGGTY